MINECIKASIPQPVYYYDMSGFFVEFRKDIYNEKYLKTLDLNKRQFDALLHFNHKNEIITSEYMKLFNITDRTALRDLTELAEKRLLIKSGNKKSYKYIYVNRNVG